MNSRGFRLASLLLVMGLSAGPSLGAASAQELEIKQQIRARLDAYGEGKASQWVVYVDDNCVCAADTKADIIRSITNRPAGVKNWYGELLDVQTHLYGNVAIVRYRVTEFTEVNGRLNTLKEWRTETHLRRAGRWVLVAASDNPITPDPEAIVLPAEVLRRYVGKYQYTPGSVDSITLESGHLFVQPTNEPKVEILPENPTSFFAKGQEWRIVFRMGPEGTVASLAFRQAGQEYVAERLP